MSELDQPERPPELFDVQQYGLTVAAAYSTKRSKQEKRQIGLGCGSPFCLLRNAKKKLFFHRFSGLNIWNLVLHPFQRFNCDSLSQSLSLHVIFSVPITIPCFLVLFIVPNSRRPTSLFCVYLKVIQFRSSKIPPCFIN